MNEQQRLQNKANAAYDNFKSADSNPAMKAEEIAWFRQQYIEAQNEYADYIGNDWLKVN